ncbi:MAG: hypothetical protein IPO92_02620 [Saprospiraceae bacterium]|nr:hypothetical protein [Saprospiraceae bacterium]
MKQFNTFILFTLIGFLSCSKDEKIFIPDQNAVINQKLILDNILGLPKVFVINISDEPYFFKDESGNVLEIPTDALISSSTGLPVRGEIKLMFQENSIDKSKLLNIPSTSVDGKLFNALFTLNLRFFQNGKDLSISKPINVYLPSESSNPLPYLFESKTDKSDKFTWKLDENPIEGLKFSEWRLNYLESIITIKGYKISVTNNNQWYIIGDISDHNLGNPYSICVHLDHMFNKTNSLVYFVAKDQNIVLKLEPISENSWEFCEKNITFSSGIKGNFVVISDLGLANYFFGMTNVVLSGDVVVEIQSSQQSNEQIKEMLKSL